MDGPPPSKGEHYRAVFHEQLNSNQFEEDFDRMLASLPEPLALEDCLECLRQNLEKFPQAMVGEVGMDRSARVPFDYQKENRELTKFVVPFDHQLIVLEAQLRVAVELKRNVSFHSVKAQKATIDLLTRMAQHLGTPWTEINIDLHSCGLSPETWRDIEVSSPVAILVLNLKILE